MNKIMETNFFKQIADLQLTGNLQMTIAKGANDTLVVSVMLQNEGCGDKAKNLITPRTLRGTAEELDSKFFESVTEPLKMVSNLMVDMEGFLKELEEVKKQSAMTKSTTATKAGKKTKASKYDIAMKKVDELDKAGQPRQAWTALPKIEEFPEHEEAIRKRRSELSAQFAPDLFANTSSQEATEVVSEDAEVLSEEETEDEVYFEKDDY